ncbi:MAG: DUF1501 domain-containing protein [Gemmataceae bacterium]|nr:DUF1501 domain-containing protein [Gemmataceae bacterium]
MFCQARGSCHGTVQEVSAWISVQFANSTSPGLDRLSGWYAVTDRWKSSRLPRNGATDDLGLRAVTDPVHVHDLHATILHLLGFDHTKLAYVHAGRLERLTGNSGNVVHGLLA